MSFVVPTIDELDNLPGVVQAIDSAAGALTACEIVFVDDASTDGTPEAIERLQCDRKDITLVRSPRRRGLGAALLLGARRGRGDYVVFLDCDVSVPPEDLRRLLQARKPDHMIVGSRYVAGGRVCRPASRVKTGLSRSLNWVVSSLWGFAIADLSHSLRILPNRLDYTPEVLTHPGFFFELARYCRVRGYRLEEIPVSFTDRAVGRSKNRWSRMMVSAAKAIRVLLRTRAGAEKAWARSNPGATE